jgi:hypothetical protein
MWCLQVSSEPTDYIAHHSKSSMRVDQKTYGVTLIPGTRLVMNAAATKAFDFPTSASLHISLSMPHEDDRLT